MGELIFLGIFTVVSIYFFYLTGDFRVSVLDKSGGAKVWPRIVLIFLLIFLIIRIIQVLREKDKKHFVFKELFTGTRLFFFLSFVAYIILLKFLGYFITTFSFLVVTINYFYKHVKGDYGTKKQIIIRNVLLLAFTFLMWAFFSEILHIMLPSSSIFKFI